MHDDDHHEEEKRQEQQPGLRQSPEHQDSDSSSSVDAAEHDCDLDVYNSVGNNGTSARTQRIYEAMLRRQNQEMFMKQDVTYQQEKWKKAGKDVVIPAFKKRYESLCSKIIKADEHSVKAEENTNLKEVDRVLKDRSKNPFEFLWTHPDFEDYLFDYEDAPYLDDSFKDKKVLDLTKAIFFNALVMEVRQENGKKTPVGVINKEFDGERAFIIHLADFSLWVTSKFEDGALMVRCVMDQDQDLASFYQQMQLSILDMSDFIYFHSHMLYELTNNPKRITVAYYHHIKRTCRDEYSNAGQERMEVDLINFLPPEIQRGEPPRPERPSATRKRPALGLLMREDVEREADAPVPTEMIKARAPPARPQAAPQAPAGVAEDAREEQPAQAENGTIESKQQDQPQVVDQVMEEEISEDSNEVQQPPMTVVQVINGSSGSIEVAIEEESPRLPLANFNRDSKNRRADNQ